MRIALIAMSGVRADNPEVMRAGLSFPGVVERGKVIASLPSLSLLTLAALTPGEHEVSYHEVLDLDASGTLGVEADLVAISTFSAQSLDAYRLADRFAARGVPVVMGGLHVTALPDEALAHATSVVIGEAEPVWARLVADAAAGRLQRVYRAGDGEEFDLGESPVPRYDLLDISKYNRLTVQTSRGCPHKCEFCASSILLTKRYKLKPVERVIGEIRAIKEHWSRPFIEFADDNSFVNRAHTRDLLAALEREHVVWFTEADVSVADDPGLLAAMRRAGCRQLLLGLESPRREGLDGLETRANWKLRQLSKYERAVRTIQSHGITVNGCFILGLDGDDASVFGAVEDFVERTGLYDVQITVLTPFPGTPLYERLLKEGRIIEPGAWNKCTLFDVNFHPGLMSASALQSGLIDLASRLYSQEAVSRRHRGFFEGLPGEIRRTSHALRGIAEMN